MSNIYDTRCCKMNKEESLSLAITVGAHIERNSCNAEMLTSFTEHELLAFANACEKMGMEKAAKICERASKISAWDAGKSVQEHCSDLIRKEIE